MNTHINSKEAGRLALNACAVRRPLAQIPEPLSLFAQLTNDGKQPHTVLLESAEPSSRRTQRSILVVSSALSIVCRGKSITLTALNASGRALLPGLEKRFAAFTPQRVAGDSSGEAIVQLTVPQRTVQGLAETERARLQALSSLTILRELAALLRELLPQQPEDVFLTGIFAYDLVDQFEPLPAAKPGNDFPDYHFYVADRMIVIDHLAASAHIMACAIRTGGEASAAQQDAEAAVESMEATTRALTQAATGAASMAAVGTANAATDAVQCDIDETTFAEQVEQLKAHVRAGDVFQIVLSRTFSMPCDDAFVAYRALRALNPSPYLFYLQTDDFTVFGASPESAVKVDGKNRQVEISPIAGTRKRGLRDDGSLDRDLDSRIEAELRLDEKENAEHMMLVDLARNDVARVSMPGSRYVAELLRTERYSHVMHLVSRVCGTLDDAFDALHAYQASMNMGTLTGAPKIRAMQLLRDYEQGRRGHYGGAIGYLRGDGSFDTAIVIRSALVRNGTAQIRAGAGIVHDSIPLLEADETRRKAEAVLKAIAKANSAKGARHA